MPSQTVEERLVTPATGLLCAEQRTKSVEKEIASKFGKKAVWDGFRGYGNAGDPFVPFGYNR